MKQSEIDKINSLTPDEVQKKLLIVQMNSFKKLDNIAFILGFLLILFIIVAILMALVS